MFLTSKKFYVSLLLLIFILLIFIKSSPIIWALNWLLDSVPFLEDIVSFLGKVLFINYFCLFLDTFGVKTAIEAAGAAPLFLVFGLVIPFLLFYVFRKIYVLLIKKTSKIFARITCLILIVIYSLLIYFLIPCK